MITNFKTFFLLGFLGCLFLIIGTWIGGLWGGVSVLAIFIVGLLVLGGWGDQFILRINHAVLLNYEHAPEVFDLVKMLSLKLNVTSPKIYLIPSSCLSAFGVRGSFSNSSIALSEGLISKLKTEELQGVIGYLLSSLLHVSIIAKMMIASLGIVLSYQPIFKTVVDGIMKLTLVKHDVFDLDHQSACLTENSLFLAGALQKISSDGVNHTEYPIHPALAHLFVASSQKNAHPPIEKRIALLEAMTR